MSKLIFPCKSCADRKKCKESCANLKKYMRSIGLPEEPNRERTPAGSVITSTKKSVVQTAFEMVEKDNELENLKISNMMTVFHSICKIKDKRKKHRETRKYFMFLCCLLDFDYLETISLLKITKRTYRNYNKLN